MGSANQQKHHRGERAATNHDAAPIQSAESDWAVNDTRARHLMWPIAERVTK